jgi:hypothetical protein
MRSRLLDLAHLCQQIAFKRTDQLFAHPFIGVGLGRWNLEAISNANIFRVLPNSRRDENQPFVNRLIVSTGIKFERPDCH